LGGAGAEADGGEFVLADGTVIKRAISEALLELPGYGERHTPVVLGESEDENLLGAVTLEIFSLVLDPFKKELRPARGLMKTTHKITTIGYTAKKRA
jgi:hypothetical protein